MNDVEFDVDNLYLEETFTDRRVGSIRRLSPVRQDGSPDPGRAVLFSGQTQLLTPMGAVPLAFDIDGSTLEQALANFPAAMQEAVERTVEEVRELRRQAASSIVVPEMGGGGFGGPGGKIQIP
ncbi:MAG: hypothetical protein IT495_16475 [Gammaproteobacteria bacterium]|nr:hypothetical protein [Gammaproteobacteria bacterium]